MTINRRVRRADLVISPVGCLVLVLIAIVIVTIAAVA